MKKKIFAIFAAAAVFTMSVIPAFAAESKVAPSVDTQKATVTFESEKSAAEYAAAATMETTGFTATAVAADVAKDAEKAIVGQLTDVAKFAVALGDDALKVAATDETKEISAEVLTIVDVNATTATANTDGTYTFTLDVEGVKEGDSVAVLHFVNNTWKLEKAAVTNGKVTVTVDSFSPFSVTKISVATKSASTDNTNTDTNTATTNNTTTAAPVSPKTGEAVPYVLFVAAVALGAAFICGKKYFAR